MVAAVTQGTASLSRVFPQPESSVKTALVIGASGQDGAYLARFLLGKGYRVVAASRDAQVNGYSNLIQLGILDKVRTVSLATTDFRSVVQVLRDVSPDEIYNLAGQSSVGLSFEQPHETFESNSLGTLNLLEAIRFLHVESRFYNACSSECFGNTDTVAADELTPFRPRSPYAVAKAAAFWSVANYRDAYGLHASSGILFNHESPLRPERFVTQKIVRAACRIAAGSKERLQLGNLGIRRDWGWAPEYVEAMWLMVQQASPDDYVIATGTSHRLAEFVEAVFEACELTWRDHVDTCAAFMRPSDVAISQGNPAKAGRQLGWYPRTLMRGVAEKMVLAARRSESRR